MGAEDPAVEADGLEEITVTGSRIIQNGFQAPTPLTVVTAEQLMLAAPSTLSDSLNQLPIFSNSFKPASTGPGVVSNAGGAYLNARSLGANRNLVLLNGQRIVPSSVSGSVAGATDINLIPQMLVQRVDVVTGGASAAYGADAVSGVVNFILDKQFTGAKVELQGGISQRDDNESGKAAAAFGTGFADGRGHMLLAGEYYHNDGVENFSRRGWARHGYANIRTPATLPQTSLSNPTRVIAPDVRPADRTIGGLITAGPLAGNYFNGDGTVSPYPYGSLRTATTMSGGGVDPDLGVYYPLLPQLERQNLFGRASFEFTPGWTAFGEALYGTSESQYFGGFSSQNFTIALDNAYLRPEVAAAAGGAPLRVGRINVDFGGREELSRNQTFQLGAGLDGRLGDWALKLYYGHGESRQISQDGHNVITANLTRAVDAVVAPAGAPGGIAAGTITCRALISPVQSVREAAAGCVPLNVLGAGKASAAAIDYITGDNRQRQHIQQDVVDLSVSGDAFSTWAGPVGMSAGLNYRKEQVVATADAIGTARGYESTNLSPLEGSYDVKEAFVEAAVPLARDAFLARSLDFNGAIRYADYSTSGGVTSWKAGMTWQVVDDYRLRATRSRDVRAANLNELYSGPVGVRPPVTDPFRGSESNPNVITVSSGNAQLKAEQGDTFTIGVVFTPGALAGFSASVDYYDVKMTDTIGTLGGGQIVAQCFAGATQLCSLIHRAPSTDAYPLGPITTLENPYLNVGKARVRGLDYELGYRLPDVLGGDWSFRLLANHVLEQSTVVRGAVTVTDQAGRIGGSIPTGFGGTPEWTATLSVGYERGPVALNLQGRYLGSGVIDNTVDEQGNPLPANLPVNANLTGNGLVPNKVSAWFYTHATARYRFGEAARSEVFLTVNNLLDKDPANIPNYFIYGTMATNSQIYDTIGRTYTAGVRLRF